MNKLRGLSLPLHASRIIPWMLPDETIGRLTAARYQLAQHFYTARPLVAVTHMLLKCKPLLPTGRECLSTSIVSRLSRLSLNIHSMNTQSLSIGEVSV